MTIESFLPVNPALEGSGADCSVNNKETLRLRSGRLRARTNRCGVCGVGALAQRRPLSRICIHPSSVFGPPQSSVCP